MPSETMIRRQSKKRLMPRKERVMRLNAKKVLVNTKEESSCGYCSGKGHRYTNCTIRKGLAAKGAQYIVTREESQNEGSWLCNRLEHSAIIEYYDAKKGNIARNVNNKGRGVFIHNVYLQNCQQPLAGYTPISSLAVEVSFLSIGTGEEISTKERMLIHGELLNTLFHKLQEKRSSHIYTMGLPLKHHQIGQYIKTYHKTSSTHIKLLVHNLDCCHKHHILCNKYTLHSHLKIFCHYPSHLNTMWQMKSQRQNLKCRRIKYNEDMFVPLMYWIQLPYRWVGRACFCLGKVRDGVE